MRKVEKLEKLLAVFIVLTLIFIWGQSVMDRELSSEESGFVMRLVTPVLELIVGKGRVTEHLVRKIAHFCEYALLGAEMSLFFAGKRRRKREGLLLAMAHGLFVAFVDETIQIFSGRGPAITDVWIDFAGITAGGIFLLDVLIVWIHAARRRKTRKTTKT